MSSNPQISIPSIDLECCILCGVCEDIAPDIFHANDAGYIEVLHQDSYEENRVQEAVNNCPKDCILLE